MFPFQKKHRNAPTKRQLKAWNAYVKTHFGPVKEILWDRGTSKFPIQIAVIEPIPEKNYYTLVTLGMITHKMRCPEGIPNRLELAIRLPADWELDNIRERWYWPIRWLRLLARIPKMENTRFEHGHTMDNCRNLTEDSQIRGFAFHRPGEETSAVELSKGELFDMLCLIPIYEGELTYATNCDTEELFRRMDERMRLGPVDMERRNVCE